VSEPVTTLVLCVLCDTYEADGECQVCGAPLCDDCAIFRDFDRFCPPMMCAPCFGPAT
jgi:hypothetical protein